ncbi:hypothetical protein DUNSADRAFT_7455 [Dunaliella salina]|uniref:Encoded protein n=1 Tax=Dunaliella salina TaxID=3046 RepID=A0ABQ7GLD4_DUNSA|nr:hypothetical protein DUNSADRAFT_7455 [Dunaliella salina]|eukprot:KAF5835420.1 hypothetical protein DUNSADRAFT_7455 [Dunaliella salina]
MALHYTPKGLRLLCPCLLLMRLGVRRRVRYHAGTSFEIRGLFYPTSFEKSEGNISKDSRRLSCSRVKNLPLSSLDHLPARFQCTLHLATWCFFSSIVYHLQGLSPRGDLLAQNS